MSNNILVQGARVHNLKNIDVNIPRNKFVVITGISGSGKSSLAFDTIYAEGQRRYIETFSAYARQFIGGLERPDVDKIDGLSPVIAIEQKTTSKNPRSTVGTITEIYDYLRLFYSRVGEAFSYNSNEKMISYTDDEIIDLVFNNYKEKKITILSTPFDNMSAFFLNKINVPCFKISSSDIDNFHLLKFIKKFIKPIILSTGISNETKIIKTIKFLKRIRYLR